MKDNFFILLIIVIGFTSCQSKTKYSDYNESDFYEVQGIINSANLNDNSFDSPIVKNISFSYFLDRSIPKNGNEKNLEMFEAKKGYPLIVLVHKDNENLSFYGRIGILKTINDKEKAFLKNHFHEKIEKLNK